MAQVTAYSQLYPYILKWLQGCELQFILRALQDAGRHICQTYDLWEEDLDPIRAVSYQQDYALAAPSADPANTPTTYSAFIHRIKSVKVNELEYKVPMFELVNGDTLRFNPLSIPNNLDNMVLECGTAGSTTIADWQALTNASLGITMNDTGYDVKSLTFAGLTFPKIALAIQTGLRAKIDNNIGFCRWYTDKFRLWIEGGTISYLTAGSTGTDISGASWLNGLTGGASVALGGLIQVKAVLRPHQNADTLPDWLLDRISDALITRVIWQSKITTGQPYYDPQGATIWETAYNIQITNLLGDKSRNYTTNAKSFEA